MKAEQLDKYLDQNVKITFKDNKTAIGILGRGYWFALTWYETGYHLNTPNGGFGFKESHDKKIEKIA